MSSVEYYVTRIEEGLVPGFARLEFLTFDAGKGRELLRMEEEVNDLYKKLVNIFGDEVQEFLGVIRPESHPLILASDIYNIERCFQEALEKGKLNMMQSKLDAYRKYAGLDQDNKPVSGPLTKVSFSEDSDHAKLLAQGQEAAYWASQILITKGMFRERGVYYDRIFAYVKEEARYVSQRMHVSSDSFQRFCGFGEMVRLRCLPDFHPFTASKGKILEGVFFIESNFVEALPDVGALIEPRKSYNLSKVFRNQGGRRGNYHLEGGGIINVDIVKKFLRKR